MIEEPLGQDRKVVKKTWAQQYKTYLIGGCVVVVLLLGLLLSDSFSGWLDTDKTYSRDKVRVAKVILDEFERSVSVQGYVTSVNNPRIYAQEQGVVKEVIKDGSMVEVGEVLAKIESPDLTNLLNREKALYSQLEVELEQLQVAKNRSEKSFKSDMEFLDVEIAAAQRSFERNKKAFEQSIISREKYEKVEDELTLARAKYKKTKIKHELDIEETALRLKAKELAIKQQKFKVEELERRVDKLTIVSRVKGMVGQVTVKQSDNIIRNQEIMTVIDLSNNQIEVEIPEIYADEVQTQMKVRISFQGRSYDGEIDSVSPEVTAGHVKSRVIFVSDVPQGIKQNQRVDVKIVFELKPQTLIVDRGPFLDSGGGRTAYVLDGDIASRREISVGGIGLTKVEILSGLEPGEDIVISDTSGFGKAEKVLLR